jgi:hypothetical protein
MLICRKNINSKTAYYKAMGKPLTKEEFISRHSAYFQQIGFDVQFAGCMYYLLDLGMNDRLDYEREDDFVIHRLERGKEIIEYYQVKHSKEIDAKMNDADSDFWKTIDNWISIYNLSTVEEKKLFFTNGRFIILTNKKDNNFLYTEIKKLVDGSILIEDIENVIKEKLTTEYSYNYALKALNSLDKIVLNEFLHKVKIVYFDNFLTAMYEHFINIFHGPTKSDQIVKNLIGDFFQYKISCGGNFTFTGKEFTQKYKSILELMSDESLTLDGYENEEFDPQLNYQNMPMVQQLKSIEAINDPTDATEYFLSDYLTRYYRFMNAFQGFVKTQLMTDVLEKKINNIARARWQNLFIKETQTIIKEDRKSTLVCEEDKVTAGNNTFTNTMNDTIPVNGYKTDQEFSNGWYLKMSNMLSIVWHYDWFKKYFLKK